MDGPELRDRRAAIVTIARAAIPFPHSSREPRVSQTTLSEMLVPAGVPALAGLQSSFQGPTSADLKDNSDGPAKAGTPTSLLPSPIPNASAPAVSAPLWIEDGADAGKAAEGRTPLPPSPIPMGEGRGEGGFSTPAPDATLPPSSSPMDLGESGEG